MADQVSGEVLGIPRTHYEALVADRDRLTRELAALKQAVVEACVATSLSSVNVRWINERVVELMREGEHEQER